MNRAPSFQFYPKDWLDIRVQRMSLAAQGAYLKNLCYMWADSHDQCSMVDDNALISRALGTTVEHWLELRKEIQCESDPIFETKDGYLVSARLKAEALKQRKYRRSQSIKGKQSAQQRFNRSSTVAEPMHQPEPNSSSSSLKKQRKKQTASRSKPKPVTFPIPEDFTITHDIWEWTAAHRFHRVFVEQEFEKFCTRNRANGEAYANWGQAFRNWLLKAREFAAARNGHAASSVNGSGRERIPV